MYQLLLTSFTVTASFMTKIDEKVLIVELWL